MCRKVSIVICVVLVLGLAAGARAQIIPPPPSCDGPCPCPEGCVWTLLSGCHVLPDWCVWVYRECDIQGGGWLIVEGKLDYYPYRLNMNDGTINMLGGEANFDCEEGIKVADDYGPTYINILGGVMWARRIEGRFNRDDGRCTVGGGILRISDIGSGYYDPYHWRAEGWMIPADGYCEVVITPWGDGGVEITAMPYVPDVVGMPEADAESTITGVVLTVGAEVYQYSDLVPEGRVISQSPAAGECVDRGTAVNLVISLGQPTVPDVSGMSPEQACAAIAAVDELVCGERLYDCWEPPAEQVPAGLVMGTQPPAGTQVPAGSSIDIVVSTGRCVLPVNLDIKPGSCPNPFNLASQGVTPVAVLGTEDFDVNDIDPVSVELAGVSAIRSACEDVAAPVIDGNECDCSWQGPDGHMDLTLKFKTQQLVTAIVDLVEPEARLVLTLTGVLKDGTPIEGVDCIILVGNVPRIIDIIRADINGDGTVNGPDFLLLKNNWYESWK